MGKSGKKPRKKMDVRKADDAYASSPKKDDKDWSFEDIARSKYRR